MVTFEISGKEHELKLTYKSIKLLNGQFDGGSYELIGRAIQGDIEAFPKIVHAALIHTGENLSLKAVDERIEELIDSGEISLDDITKICDEVVTQSFFYEATVEKLMKMDPQAKQMLDLLRN